MFELYSHLGFTHITDFAGYDHMLFLLALSAPFIWKDYKSLLIMVTAFTIGHSLTLALAVFDIVPVNKAWIEFLIPVSICITAIIHFLNPQPQIKPVQYLVTLGFGLIHGLGFSNFLKELLMGEESIVLPLFYFNIGLEIGQILVLALIIGLSSVISHFKLVEPKLWTRILCVVCFIWAAFMALQRL
jgi:HupE / UreJ protein